MKKINIAAEEFVKILKDVKFFKHISGKDQKEFIELSEIFEFSNGEKIISEGETNPYLYIVLEGIANVNLTRKDKSIYITTIGGGDVIGEAAIFINYERTTNIIAFNKVKILRLYRNSFISFIKKNPDSGIKILMIIIHTLLSKLHIADNELAFEKISTERQDSIDGFIAEFFNN